MEPTLPTTQTVASVIRFKRSYKVLFSRNPLLSETFKQLDNCRFDKEDDRWGWVVGKEGLYDAMMAWKGNPGVSWEFLPAPLRDEFLLEAIEVRDAKRARLALLDAMAARSAHAEAYKQQLRADRDYTLPFYQQVLKPGSPINFYYHQHITTAWLIERHGGILAAEMGLGKTFVFCLAALRLCPPGQKVVIVAPKSLVLGIIADLTTLLPQDWYFMGYGRKQPNTPEQATFLLASYSYFARSGFSVEKHLVPFGAKKPGAVALDESHMVKNHGSLTYKNINAAFGGQNIPIICSTGTPIKSWGREVWTQLHLIDPITFHSRTDFERAYCGAYLHPYWKRIEYDPLLEKRQELNALLQPYMFRVRKEDVINLPPKIYRKLVIPLTDTERRDYNKMVVETREALLQDGNQAAAMVLVGKLRHYCAQQKISYVKELVDRHNQEGEKVVVIDQFKDTIYQLAQHYGNRAVVHTGDQDIDERQAAKTLFQKDSVAGVPDGVDNFFGSVDTCKYGLTLTAACIMYLMTMPWTPAECDQVYDRLHRISQTRTVLIFIPVLQDTIDEYVYDKNETKRGGVLEIIDDQGFAGDMKTSTFNDVLKYLTNKSSSEA
jgi:SNF2 family DNA or RNA helicase